MHTESIPALVMRCKRIAEFCALFIAALGVAVLIGWMLNIAVLKGVLPGLATMKANTALCFLFAGASLALANKKHELLRWHNVQLVLAAIVALLGLLTVGEYLFVADFGIDQLLFNAPLEPISKAAPGRMALATATGFTFTGLALVLLDNHRWRNISQVSAVIGTIIGVLAMLGYGYGISALYGVFAYSSVALHTALGFAVINLGVIFSRPERGLMSVVNSNTSGGVMARQLLPFVLTVPFLIGWLHVQGEKQGLYGPEFGVVLVAITYVVLFAILIWHSAEAMRRADQLRIDAEHSRNKQQAQLTGIINTAMDAIITLDEEQRVRIFNPAAEQMFGYTAEEMIGASMNRLIPARLRQMHVQHIHRFADEGATSRSMSLQRELLAQRFDGTEFPVEISISKAKVHGEQIFTAILRDISERHWIEAELQIAATAFEAQVGIVITDTHATILRVNQAFTLITGYTAEEAVGQTPRLLKSGYHDAAFYHAMWESILNTGSWQGEIWDRRKNGEIYPKWMTITAVTNKDGATTHYVGTQIDITERKAAEEEIKNLAFFDPLTKLPNRRLLLDRLQHALTSSVRSGKEGALLFIDLDNFKSLNDTLGHDVGDLLLQQVAQRLKSCVREGDTVARLGGDEFVVMLEDLSKQAPEAADETEIIGKKILATLNLPYQLATHEYHSTSSIGATLFLDHKDEMDELFQQADIAMYQAKKSGRNTLRFFDPMMQDTINVRAALEDDLRKALLHRQFHLYYQIQLHSSGSPLGAEALIRWIHPARGLVSPSEFIPLAEESGLILPIGLWVLETACAQIKAWEQDELTSQLILSINISARQFQQPGFVAQVHDAVQRFAINPTMLKIELTESILIQNVENIIDTMNALKVLGIRFSLDDFGTGYSSLQYIKRLPLSQLKIDRSFVRDLVANSSSKEIVCTIIAMAHNLNLDVIAEGVETEEQRQFLLNAGCSYYQGYLFSKPLPVDQFEKLLKPV